MAKPDKHLASAEKWESGKFGREEKYARRADKAAEVEYDQILGMQMISIRLQKQLIEDLKFCAKHNGIGYQPLIREVLNRFVAGEKKRVLQDQLEEMKLKEKTAASAQRTRKVA